MTREKKKHTKNIILMSLICISLVMAIGYSALSSNLKINGTSNISSDFKVIFTNIQEGTKNGVKSSTSSFTNTTATFTVDLEKPGSTMEYILTVENQGSLDAYLESIEGLDEANGTAPTYITFKLSGITRYTRLNAEESKTFKVIVTYDESATEIPEESKQLTLTLNFAQVSGEIPDPEPEPYGNAVEYLINNKVEDTVVDGGNGLVAIDNTGEITIISSPREYRYIGPSPDNYVYFNTYSGDEWTLIAIMDEIETLLNLSKSNEECETQKQQFIEGMGGSLPEGTSLECRQTGVSGQSQLWRIIGIFDGKLKLIRNESIGDYSWDNKPSGTGSSTSLYGSNDWSDSALQEVLNNGPYYNRTSGNCPNGQNGATTACDFSSNGLTEEAKLMIELSTWKLGGTSSYNSSSNGLAQHFYEYERGTNVYSGRPTEWIGYIGLMYPSDYGFATSGGATTGRSACLVKELYSWNDSSYIDCKNNNWLYDSFYYQWSLISHAGNSYEVFAVSSSGPTVPVRVSIAHTVRPSLYLKSNI